MVTGPNRRTIDLISILPSSFHQTRVSMVSDPHTPRSIMSFRQFLGEGPVIRTGSITALSTQSKRYGDRSVIDFKSGKGVLIGSKGETSIDDRLDRIEKSLGHLLDGLINQRKQIGGHVGVSTVGHLLARKSNKRSSR